MGDYPPRFAVNNPPLKDAIKALGPIKYDRPTHRFTTFSAAVLDFSTITLTEVSVKKNHWLIQEAPC